MVEVDVSVIGLLHLYSVVKKPLKLEHLMIMLCRKNCYNSAVTMLPFYAGARNGCTSYRGNADE